MKNKEKFAKEIIEIAISGEKLAVRNDSVPVACISIKCSGCIFENSGCDGTKIKQWAESEYVPHVDWSKVPMDAEIEVSQDGKHWYKRHYAGVFNSEKGVYAWADGKTSYTTLSQMQWKHARLADTK